MKKEFTPFQHGYYGLDGYEQYNIQSNAVDIGYLLWNKTMQGKIQNESFNWNGIFDAKPYLEFRKPVNSGYAFPNFNTVTKRNIKLFINERFENYVKLITDSGYLQLTKAEQMQAVHAALSMIHTQLERQIEQLEIIDNTLINAIKVFYYECEQNIKKEANTAKQRELINELTNDLKRLYQVGIRVVANTDILLEKWIPKRTAKAFVPDKIGDSLRNAIAHLLPRKEPILEALVPIFEKYIHLETAKFKILNDEPLLDESDSVPLMDNPAITPAIEEAVYRKKNQNEARKFLELYAPIHQSNRRITNGASYKEIRPEEHGIYFSERTFASWIKDYKEALERFEAVQK